MNRPRILVISERFMPESFLVNELVESFVASGLDVTVLTQVPSYPSDRLFPGYRNRLVQVERMWGARILRVRTVLGYKSSVFRKVCSYLNFALLTTLVLLLTGPRYDGVFVFQTGPLTQAFALRFAIGAHGRRVMWTQDVWPDTVYEFGFPRRGLPAWVLERFVRGVYADLDTILVSSPGFVETARGYAPRGCRIEYVPQWVPAELLRRQPQPTRAVASCSRGARFCFAGNVGSMQNMDRVLRGWARASVRRPDLRLEIIGDGSGRASSQQLATRLGLSNVTFVGRLPMTDVFPRFLESDFLLLPLVGTGTVSKTIPAKFLAYLAAGRPIIGVARGSVAELVRKHGLGLVGDPTDVEDIARVFLDAAALGSREREEMMRNSRELLRTEFDRRHAISAITSALAPSQPDEPGDTA